MEQIVLVRGQLVRVRLEAILTRHQELIHHREVIALEAAIRLREVVHRCHRDLHQEVVREVDRVHLEAEEETRKKKRKL